MGESVRRPLMAGNWKMNLNHLEAIALVQKIGFMLTDDDYEACDVAVLPPFTDIRSVQTLVDADKLKIKYGGQDLSEHDSGAYTGEIAGPMLAKLGCTYVVVGHSERRQYHGESDESVNTKAVAAFRNGLTPIICIGENLDVRRAGEQVACTLAQLDVALSGDVAGRAADVVIAYEPIWAIGTGEVATPDDAQEVCGAIRRRLAEVHGDSVADAVRVLYGGSMKPDNVAGLMAMADIDGGLVGGASLDADGFAALVRHRLLA